MTQLSQQYNEKYQDKEQTKEPQKETLKPGVQENAALRQRLEARQTAATSQVVAPPAPVALRQEAEPAPAAIVRKGSIQRPDAIAVVIGNAGYAAFKNGIPDVAYARADAQAMKDAFISLLGIKPENVIFAEDATQASLIAIFGSANNHKGKLYNWIKPGVSEVFIYYSGHGAPSLANSGAYLVPVDAATNYLSETGYSVDLLYDNVGKLPSVANVIILDACFSGDSGAGPLYKNMSPALLKTTSHVRNMNKSCLITSTSVGEVSNWYAEKRHGLFTYYLLEGMQGGADLDSDRKVTLAELEKYVTGEVAYKSRRLSGREQNPLFVSDIKSEVFVSF
ncbi:MAG: caspase domain-containing protein [Desulfovibrionaceae bacterium]